MVRLGDPSMTPLPARPGLIDLTQLGDDILLDAFAISMSRYAVCTNSGVLHLAAAMQTPMVSTDAISAIGFPFHSKHLVLTKTFINGEGRAFRQAEAYGLGIMEREIPEGPPGYRVQSCTAAQLIEAADQMFSMTSEVTGWRESEPDPPLQSPSSADFFMRLIGTPARIRQDFNFALS